MYHFAALHPAQWESTRTTVTLTTRDGHFYLRSVLMHNPANYSQYFKEQQLHLVERFNTAGLFLHEVNNANSALHSSRQGFYWSELVNLYSTITTCKTGSSNTLSPKPNLPGSLDHSDDPTPERKEQTYSWWLHALSYLTADEHQQTASIFSKNINRNLLPLLKTLARQFINSTKHQFLVLFKSISKE